MSNDDANEATPNRLGSTATFSTSIGQRDTGAYAPRLFQGKMNCHMNMTPEAHIQMKKEYTEVIAKQQEYFAQQKRNVLVEKAALTILSAEIATYGGFANLSKEMIWKNAAEFVAARPEEFRYD